MKQHRFAHWLLGGLLLGSAAAAAWGQQAPASLLRLLRSHPPAPAGLVEAQTDAPDGAAAAADVTPPVLTAFSAGTTLDVSKATPPFSILIKAKDNLSGVLSVMYSATGPSGQRMFGFLTGDYPSTGFNRRGGFSQFYVGRLLQPGAWVLDDVRIEDVVGNPGKYDVTALASLGNTRFTVVNPGAYDAVAPTLTSGQVLTPAVSLSSFAKGTTNLAPFIGLKLTAADTGNTAVAGLAGAGAAFCLADETRCLEFLIATPNGGNPPTGTFLLGTQVASLLGQVPGDYLLYEVVLWDQAGNFSEFVSTAFGGTTNFAKLFPSTKITIKP